MKDTMLGQATKYYSALEQRSMVYLLYLPEYVILEDFNFTRDRLYLR
jgi:hypothetical protein